MRTVYEVPLNDSTVIAAYLAACLALTKKFDVPLNNLELVASPIRIVREEDFPSTEYPVIRIIFSVVGENHEYLADIGFIKSMGTLMPYSFQGWFNNLQDSEVDICLFGTEGVEKLGKINTLSAEILSNL